MPLLIGGEASGSDETHKAKRLKVQAHEFGRPGSRIFAPYRVRNAVEQLEIPYTNGHSDLDNRTRIPL